MAAVSLISTVDSKLQPDIPIKPMHLLQYFAHGQQLPLRVKQFEIEKKTSGALDLKKVHF